MARFEAFVFGRNQHTPRTSTRSKMTVRGTAGTNAMRNVTVMRTGKANRCSSRAVTVERGCARDANVTPAMMSVRQALPKVEN
jgi:hypothetical protein